MTIDELDNAGEAITTIFSKAESEIISDIAKRITEYTIALTVSNIYQINRLSYMGASRDTVITKLSQAMLKTEDETVKILDSLANKALSRDNKILTSGGYTPINLKDNEPLQAILNSFMRRTNNTMQNLTRTTIISATEQITAVYNELDAVSINLLSGAMSPTQAIENAIKSLTDKGIKSTSYLSGHSDYIDVAVRRASMTGFAQSIADLQLENAKQVGIRFVKMSAHSGARTGDGIANHAGWQGKILTIIGDSTEQYPDFIKTTGYGEGIGYAGYNCRHSHWPYVPDGSYDSLEEVEFLNNRTVKYNGKDIGIYEATQQQRYIERGIRKWKREAEGMAAAASAASGKQKSDLEMKTAAANRKVREWQARQTDFVKQTGLRRQYERERVY